MDLAALSLREASNRVRAKEISPVDLTRSMLDRIERLNPILNAYITVTADRALADARRAEKEIASGRYRGPLHGIPIALKDIVATEGIRTTAGSRILGDWVPDTDATVARRLREGGAVLLGKLNTHEFAYGVTTNNPHYGAARNPWNIDRIPGGSSGGSGVATAARLAYGTIGTDTGGSIRIPASLCGVVGFKPTYGRVSKAGVVPLSWLYDHVGPLTREVGDSAMMLGTIAGYDPSDAATIRMPVEDFTSDLDRGVRGLRLGMLRSYGFERAGEEVVSAVEEAGRTLGALGAELVDVELPGLEETVRALFRIVLAEARQYHARSLRERPGDFGKDVAALLMQPPPDAPELLDALRAVDALTGATRCLLETVDALILPSTPIPAPPIAPFAAGGTAEADVIFSLIWCTAPFNATRLPALSLPCGFTKAGLPVGLQVVGRPLDESLVLRVGHSYETGTEWHRRFPPDPSSLR